MNKAIAILILCMAAFVCSAGNGKKGRENAAGVNASKLTSLISEYSSREGFEVFRVGRLGTSAIKALVRLGERADSDSEDISEMKNMIVGIKKLAIVDYEDCSQADRQSFERKVGRLLNDDSLIMEMKDDGDICKIYGVVDESSDRLRNFVLYYPSGGTLICFFGSVSLDRVMSAIAQ